MLANALLPENDYFSQTMEETFALMDEIVSYTHVYNCGKLSDITRIEIFQFIAYLAASDDTVKKEETDFINLYFDTEWTPQTLAAYLMANGIHNDGFDKMIPLSLEILVQADNVLIQEGLLRKQTISETLICLYQLLGEMFIKSSPHPTKWEASDLASYMDLLDGFVNENLTEKHRNQNTTKAPPLPENEEKVCVESEDIGIVAPKKKDDLSEKDSHNGEDTAILIISKEEDLGIIAPKKS